MGQRLNRRQRKKHHKGEFREFGFIVKAALREGVSHDEAERLSDAFIEHCIEANRLTYAGAIVDKLDGLVEPEGRDSATEAHRALVREWLEAQPALTDVHVTPLFDAWHDWPRDETQSTPA